MSELTTTVKNDLNTWSLQTPELTSKTNICTLRLCVRFKYASFYQPFQSFQSLFESLFESISIDYKTLEHWSWIVSYFQNMSPSAQHKYISKIRSVCVYSSSFLFCHCLNWSISIHYKTLELNDFVFVSPSRAISFIVLSLYLSTVKWKTSYQNIIHSPNAAINYVVALSWNNWCPI